MSVSYREKLGPAAWVWASAALLGGGFGLIFVPRSELLALVVALVATGTLAALLVRSTPQVTVLGGSLQAGRAQLPLEFSGAVEPLDAVGMRHAHGPGLDARAYLCIRGWIPTGVRVIVDDPRDPTPYWLISSRHPTLLAEAIEQARAEQPSATQP
ncbi:MAG: DUF3093 domain-containing protein [Kineosporiaceae bacterium]